MWTVHSQPEATEDDEEGTESKTTENESSSIVGGHSFLVLSRRESSMVSINTYIIHLWLIIKY